ncbi:MAG: sce7726 family protein [Hyphomonadaceae bacterium]|nr:sce7726 family protein [Hyphomonadaceae bacterium]
MRPFLLPYEADLKAAVIDRLFDSGAIDDDAVIISEMVIADWTRRADVVLANGSLVAFEIKSPADSLTRLEGQMESLNRAFEKVILVVAPRFEEKALQLASGGVGVWVVGRDGSLKERQRARKRTLAREASIQLMTASELKHLLFCNGVRNAQRLARHELHELAMRLPEADLVNAARNAVKARYRAKHLAFLSDRAARGTLSAVSALHRKGRNRDTRPEEGALSVPNFEIEHGHPLLVHSPAGPILRRRNSR